MSKEGPQMGQRESQEIDKWAWILGNTSNAKRWVLVNNWTNNDQNNKLTKSQNNMDNLTSFFFFCGENNPKCRENNRTKIKLKLHWTILNLKHRDKRKRKTHRTIGSNTGVS